MKKILLFGAGKSATVLIEYLLEQCSRHGWLLTVADANPALIKQKIGGHSSGRSLSFDIHEKDLRRQAVAGADVVISLLPPALHSLVAQDCLAEGKHLLTASYIDEAMEALRPEIESKDLLFLCEMGLDPGIDHMSLKKMIDGIHAAGGKIQTVRSHCGGLIAPESDNNPWHYKISWNPRNVVQAGKSGATFLSEGAVRKESYVRLFSSPHNIIIRGTRYQWYPNRDSLSYLRLYNLPECRDFVRTTLRHPCFMLGWSNLISMGLTSESDYYETDGLSIAQFFREIYRRNNLGKWMKDYTDRSRIKQALRIKIAEFNNLYKELKQAGDAAPDKAMAVNEQGNLEETQHPAPAIKTPYDERLLNQEVNFFKRQLVSLGFKDDETLINKGRCSAADVLQFALEKNLALAPGDKDMVVMCHQVTFEQEGQPQKRTSSLVLEGKDDTHTAMATTVGLPLGIAAVMLLKSQLSTRGLLIPIMPEIYEPVLQALEMLDIRFEETTE